MQTQAIVSRNPEYRLTLIMNEEEAAALHYIARDVRGDLCSSKDKAIAQTIRDEIEAMLQQAKMDEEGA